MDSFEKVIGEVEDVLKSLREVDPEVEGQRHHRSDERLKEAIDRLDGALGELHRLQAAQADDEAEVVGQRFHR